MPGPVYTASFFAGQVNPGFDNGFPVLEGITAVVRWITLYANVTSTPAIVALTWEGVAVVWRHEFTTTGLQYHSEEARFAIHGPVNVGVSASVPTDVTVSGYRLIGVAPSP